MKHTWIIALLMLTSAAAAQVVCEPRPLPWFEDFENGFTYNNGWINTTLDTTFFEYDHCWIYGFEHYCGWESMISFEYFNMMNPPPIRNNLLQIAKSYWDFNGVEPGWKYAVTPPFDQSPTSVTFRAYYPLAKIHGTAIGDPLQDTVFPDGLMVSIGYITDEDDPSGSYMPVDTVYVTSRDLYNKTLCCSDLGGAIIPPPRRLQFRVADPMADWRGTILCFIDSISVTDSEIVTDTTITYYDTICEGTAYNGYGFNIPSTLTPGTHTFDRTECSDTAAILHHLELNVLAASVTHIYDTVEAGTSYPFLDTIYTIPGTYTHLLGTTADGCDSMLVLHLEWCRLDIRYSLSRPFFDFDHPVVTFTDLTENATHTRWQFSDGITIDSRTARRQLRHPLPDSLDVTLSVSIGAACRTDSSFTLPVVIRSMWFPNAFTPGAEQNNRFGAVTSLQLANYELTVYNHRGAIVFHTDDILSSWDGTHSGRPLPQGAYVYRFSFADVFGLRQEGTGTVILLR